MDAQVIVVIVGDTRREAWINQLIQALGEADITCMVTWDSCEAGALNGHIEALEMAACTTRRCIIMEDDAIPVVDFLSRAQAFFDRLPDDLISFYLGTGRPKWVQPTVDRWVAQAELLGSDHVVVPTLIHGVCYSIPPSEIPRVLEALRSTTAREADYAIGAAWGRPVIYPVESLVEHRDGATVERHPDGQPRTERRVARRLAGPLMYQGDP